MIVYQINQLRAFPLSAIDIADWAKSLLEFDPELDLNALRFLIAEMKADRFEYDDRLAIKNFTRNLKYVEKTETGYRIKTAIWPG